MRRTNLVAILAATAVLSSAAVASTTISAETSQPTITSQIYPSGITTIVPGKKQVYRFQFNNNSGQTRTIKTTIDVGPYYRILKPTEGRSANRRLLTRKLVIAGKSSASFKITVRAVQNLPNVPEGETLQGPSIVSIKLIPNG